MATRRPRADDDDFDDIDPEGPSAEDLAKFGDEFITCPNCKRSIYDQSELCPHCGEAIERPKASVPVWAIVTAVVVVGVLVVFALRL